MHVSSSKFHYNKQSRQFSADISDFGSGFHLERVYPDAMDLGFTLVSDRTGREMKFAEHSVCKENGDISYWTFVPINPPAHLRDLTVVLWND